MAVVEVVILEAVGRMAGGKIAGGKTKPTFSRGTPVSTPDGEGVTVGMNMRKNTNGGPGVRQYVVRLRDGKIRHYRPMEINVIVNH